jgi:hypothetical protein
VIASDHERFVDGVNELGNALVPLEFNGWTEAQNIEHWEKTDHQE